MFTDKKNLNEGDIVTYRGEGFQVEKVYFTEDKKTWEDITAGLPPEECMKLSGKRAVGYSLKNPLTPWADVFVLANDPHLYPESLASRGQCFYKGGLEPPYISDDGEMYHVLTEKGTSYGTFGSMEDAEQEAKKVGKELGGNRIYILKAITYFVHQEDKWVILEEVPKELQSN